MPLSAWYSVGIRIYGKQGTQFYNATDLPDREAKEFIKSVEGWLKRLAKLRTGSDLLQAIDGSNHICYIMKADPTKGSLATQFAPKDEIRDKMRRQLNGMAAPIMPVKKILIADKNLHAKAYNDLKGKLKDLGAPLHKTDTNANFVFLLVNMTKGGVDNPIQKIANVTGKSVLKVQDWMFGMDSPDRDDYFKIVAAFYEYFPPGPGTDTCAEIGPVKDKDSPEFIQLGHELIHCWRMMTGRRIVGGNSWEEEAMTVGLSPFANLRFTENRLREEAKLKKRLKYGSMVAANDWMTGAFKNQVESGPQLFGKF